MSNSTPSLVRYLILLFIAGLSVSLKAGEPLKNTPESVTKALYHSAASDIGTSPKAIESQRKWLTADLYSRILRKLRQPTPAGDAPEIEGDLFLDAQEMPTKMEFGKTTQSQQTADVEVVLFWSSERRACTVKLKQIDGIWRIDDVIYDKHRSLRKLVQ